MHRNYYSDPNFGGAAKCVTFERYGSYENFSTPAVYSFGGQGSTKGQVTFDPAPCYTSRNKANFEPFDDSSPQETFYLIYIECQKCTIMRHPYAENGYGCTYWRREDTMNEPADCCDFIYDENCGTTPKYQIYDASCGSNV
ncbi:uncharacterized protein LOC119401361 [Rhipicephalus sanguineus]|uniref:uncharacterized protein LOC119401361 n=1 Tax=Rhipicephalus sanguineus TaxID=34632 RepID=UPI001893155D|nr:uncharacterized protein LOC119401361 [Rhipicephalus sanguineus]